MIVVEYRLPLPLSLNEYNLGLRYVVARVSEASTGAQPGEGVEILKNEPFGFPNPYGMPGPGMYTEKVLRFGSRAPPLIRRLLPESATEILEISVYSYPRTRTRYINRFLGDRLYLSIESNHLPGIGTAENALDLGEEDLQKRELIYLDIAANRPRKMKGEDPSSFVSQKTGRGLLQPGWFCKYIKGFFGGEKRDEMCTEREERGLAQSGSERGQVASDSSNSEGDFSSEKPESPGGSVDSDSGVTHGFRTTESDSPDEKKEELNGKEAEEQAQLKKTTMCCYKVVKMEFTGFGMRRFVQRWVTRGLIPNGFIDIHRKMFCWMDDWIDLTPDDITAIESETAKVVREKFQGSTDDLLSLDSHSSLDSSLSASRQGSLRSSLEEGASSICSPPDDVQ